MESIQRFGIRLNPRYIIYGIVIWWLAMLIGYSIIAIRSHRHKDRLTKSGIEITREFSKLVSLPLLENNDQSLHTLLTSAAEKKGVIYASVVDHRDNVVAFTGTGNLMPDRTEAAQSIDKVSSWEGGFSSHATLLNFASDVTYSGTKIGEIFIGLSTAETRNTKTHFIILAALSILALLVAIVVFRYNNIKAYIEKTTKIDRSNLAGDSTQKDVLISCPLCGTPKPFSDNVFSHSSLDRLITTSASKRGTSAGDGNDSKRIHERELSKNADFSGIRRQIILRCTEIIKKLVA